MAHLSHLTRTQVPLTTTWVKGTVPSSLRQQPSASAVPLPGSLNAHPSKAPQTNTAIASPSGNQPTVQPQKKFTKEVLTLAAGELDRIREETESAFGFVQVTESNSQIANHGEVSDPEKAQTKLIVDRLKALLGNNDDLKSKINQVKGAFQDNSTGLYFEIHNKVKGKNKSPQYVVVFPGTGIPGMTDIQWKNNISQITGQGGVPPAYRQAEQLIAVIKSNLPEGATLELAGHSLGGGIANYTGLKHDLRSTCFNAAALGKACLEDLGEIPKDRLEKQVHIRIKSDWLSSARFLQKFQKFSSSLIPYAPPTGRKGVRAQPKSG